MSKINFAHLRERATNGGWINFAVFEADATNRTNSGRNAVLNRLTLKARASGLRVDQSALAFEENGRIKYFGDPNLVQYLARNFRPYWTHSIDD
jgi:hypothetical protein